MAGYNRGIVATRKLNKKNKARLGRGGDTKIREVDGRDSHVNALEAYLIDVDRKAGERYAKRVGAGTTNPLTGMPEYHTPNAAWTSDGDMIFAPHDDSQHTHANSATITGDFEYGTDAGPEIPNITDPSTGAAWTAPTGRQTYETLSGYTPEQLETYLQKEFDMADDSMQYIEGFKEEPLGFIGEEETLATGRALETRGFTEKGLLASKEASGREAEVARAGIGETYRGARETLGRGFAAGSRGIGQSMTQARAGAATAAAKSGFARSGTVTGAMGQQMKALTQDYGQLTKGYTQGIAAAGRRADIGRAGIAAGEKTAAETYTLGMEGAAADYTYATDTAELTRRKADYFEQKRQLDELYADVAAIPK